MDPPLISDTREQKWVAEISETLDRQLEIKVDIPPVSIFKIPETITTKKPEAYKPQHVGFGPYHHFQPGPYSKMEQKKLVLLQTLLEDHKINDFRHTILDKVEKLVPVIRACYETFLQDDNASMAWVFAIDGLLLLNLFRTSGDKHHTLDLTKRLLARDIMMVENQIPFLVLKEINEALYSSGSNFPSSSSFTEVYLLPLEEQIPLPSLELVTSNRNLNQISEEDHRISWSFLTSLDQFVTAFHSLWSRKQTIVDDQPLPISQSLESTRNLPPFFEYRLSPSIFRSFSEIHSPLELCSDSQTPIPVQHLLDYMYGSIINNKARTTIPHDDPTPSMMPSARSDFSDNRSSSDPFSRVSNFVQKIPDKEIAQLYKQTITILHNFSTEKIATIPSASKLHCRAGFRFQVLPENQGIQNIYVDHNNIYLPRVTLNNDSEVILRNLVAYEAILMPHSGDHLPLMEYMGLMCGLIVNVEDVKLLINEKIIKLGTGLGEGEAVKMFVGMSDSILSLKTKHKSELQKVIAEINKIYESRPRIRAYLLMKKLASWVLVGLTHIGSFVGATWKIVAFMISIVTVFMLTYQAYCDVYGCDKNNVTMLPYASSYLASRLSVMLNYG